MVKRLRNHFLVSCIVFVMLVSFTSAFTTPIDVYTLPNHRVSISISDGEVYYLLESFHVDSDANGRVSVSHTSDRDVLDVIVKVSKDGEKIFLETFEDYQAGESISIKLDYSEINGEYDPLGTKEEASEIEGNAEEAVDETDVTAEETNDNSEGSVEQETPEGEEVNALTGEVVASPDLERNPIISYIIYGVVGFLVVVFVVLFLVIKKSKSVNSGDSSSSMQKKEPTAMKKIDSSIVNNISDLNNLDEITALERKIKEAEKQLNMIKNKEKIAEVQRKLEQDQRELEKLQKGDDSF